MRRPLRLALALLPLLAACTREAPEPDVPDLPDEDPLPDTDGSDTDWPIDTDPPTPPGIDPMHWLYRYQSGTWSLGPAGGPHTTLTGDLLVYEFVDYELPEPGEDTDADTDTDLAPWESLEENPLHCMARWSLTGVPAERACDGCDATFEVTFTLIEGDPGPCYDPELPVDGKTRVYGWKAEDGVILHDHAKLGVWYPWFYATFSDDTVQVAFEDRQAVSLEEEEED